VADITDQIVDFYNALFERIFFTPFAARIRERRRRDAVRFQVLEAAAATSQSLERFFAGQRLAADAVSCILGGLESATDSLTLEQIGNPITPPESIVEDLLKRQTARSTQEAVYRVALYSVVQGLMQIGPVMAEWQKTGFPATFELSRRVIARLNAISEQLGVLGSAGMEAADERYELLYRDYLSQRFNRVEAGTVRMTTNLSVDLSELFVMPNVLERSLDVEPGAPDTLELMSLSRAREVLARAFEKTGSKGRTGVPALEQVRLKQRNVIVGAPGSGKSTFLEWFQLRIADAKEEFVLGGQQAIPVLLRVRQLDCGNLPTGSGLLEKATGSQDFAALMPGGWIHRQMSAGTVMFMLDGLDEVDPQVRDGKLVPWFTELCQRYPKCSFIVSSRPVGYPTGLLRKAGFSESELLDFGEPQVAAYAGHWCTAIRLARNEAHAEARREGAADGTRIVSGFEGHPHIKSLARNPLMLSAICLVNYFEGGQLPKDRAVLYRLCVEGLLHNWDQRRGILSEFAFEEKLRAVREVALQMQASGLAEFELTKVQEAFSVVLKDERRAASLLEHIRYRTGLLLERRSGVFAFAHLTFQEFLAARAIYEGNQSGIEIMHLIQEHSDARWQEVIALYCGIAPAPEARRTIEALIGANAGAGLLDEAYFSAGPEVAQDPLLRYDVMKAVARADSTPATRFNFAEEEFAPIANEIVGQSDRWGAAYAWLLFHPERIDARLIVERIRRQLEQQAPGLTVLNFLVHYRGDDDLLGEVAKIPGLYDAPARHDYDTQADVAFEALVNREGDISPEAKQVANGADIAWLCILNAVLKSPKKSLRLMLQYLPNYVFPGRPSRSAWPGCAPLMRRIIERDRIKLVQTWFDQVNRLYSGSTPDQPQRQRRRPKGRSN
jgi:hypothetical protein